MSRDSRFFLKKEGTTLGVLSDHIQGTPAGSFNAELLIEDICPIQEMTDFSLSFIKHPSYLPFLEGREHGAFLVMDSLKDRLPSSGNFILSRDLDADFARIVRYFYPQPFLREADPSDSFVSKTACLGKNVIIGPGAVIAQGAQIGDNTKIGANAVIGPFVVIGENCDIGAGVSIQCALIGSSVVIHQNAAIGQAGFGFAVTKDGFLDIPQVGRVIIEEDVHVGACTTIDRGGLRDTVIGAHTRIDNLVQIGHNVRIGRGCILVAQAGIAGSTEIGDFSIIGGQVGIADNVKIGKRVKIASKSGVMRDIEDGAVMGGIPAVPIQQWHRTNIALMRLTKKDQNK